jgi:hypothetical protein
MMDVLTTRVLSYPDENGAEREIVLTVFMPTKTEREDWKGGFVFTPPNHRKMVPIWGADFLQALLCCLTVARAYIEGSRAHWQGMLDLGLPDFAERPASWALPDIPPPEANPGNLDVLSTRSMGYPDESGAERELLLTVFVPFKAEGEKWKCGFTFGPPLNAPLRYGVGTDFIEALLDGLAMARVIFEEKVPEGWVSSVELCDASSLPYKIGRSFGMDPAPKTPGMPESSAG